MPYASYSFYKDAYYGDVLTQGTADRFLDMASDDLDTITFGRLRDAFPENPVHAVKVKKAVCAVADALCMIDMQRKATVAQKASDGTYHGAVSSISSGKEAVSYSAVGSASSAYTAAAQNDMEKVKLINNIAYKYLANIPDANGFNLLYAGW